MDQKTGLVQVMLTGKGQATIFYQATLLQQLFWWISVGSVCSYALWRFYKTKG